MINSTSMGVVGLVSHCRSRTPIRHRYGDTPQSAARGELAPK
jgi:hypothetical protein